MILEEDAEHVQSMLVLGYFQREDELEKEAMRWGRGEASSNDPLCNSVKNS